MTATQERPIMPLVNANATLAGYDAGRSQYGRLYTAQQVHVPPPYKGDIDGPAYISGFLAGNEIAYNHPY